MLGTVLADAFQIVRAVGEGGMARVYEARHTRLSSKRFAVKVLLPAHAQSTEVVMRFQREAEAASSIRHPNVVDVYDVHCTSGGQPFLVCEYLDGSDFASYLQTQGKVDAAFAVSVVRQVCRALVAAHACGVVHRDIKPENVFLVGDPAAPFVKVIDFGISKVSGAGASLTRTGMIMGTPGYMAPEQARGARVDHRVDIYGVGAMLYRAVTGTVPFDSDDAGEALNAVLTQEPIRPRSIEPSIPPALELVIERAMAKEPADRYGSMEELDAELVAFAPDSGTSVGHWVAPASAAAGQPSTGISAVSGTAATVVSSARGKSESRSNPTLDRVTRDARWARPMLVLGSLLGYLWVWAIVVDALVATLILTKAPEALLSATEVLLVVLGVTALSLTPLVFWIRYLVRQVWRNTVRSVEVSGSLRRVITLSLFGYAVGSLALRLTDGFQLVETLPASPHWSVLLSGVSLVTGMAAYWGPREIGRLFARR